MAAVILTGGLFGSVLLSPGTAFAATTVNTTTAITGTTQTSTPGGTTLNVQVSVRPASGTVWPAGKAWVSDGPSGCSITLVQQGSNDVGVGNCNIYDVRNGTYGLTAYYEGSSSFGHSWSKQCWVNVNHGGGAYVTTSLSCTRKVYTRQWGLCTLWVTNRGWAPSWNVTAQIALPWQLRAQFCGNDTWNRGWNYGGCFISRNTAYEDIGTLNPGQTRQLTVIFTAYRAYYLWGWNWNWWHASTVKVVGSATWYTNWWWWWYGQHTSYSVAWVKIVPRGWWWLW
jgi:hypothetical protein